jgi:thiamine monophosphate kinase
MVQLSNVGVIIEPDLIPIDKHVQEISDKMKIPAWHFAFVIGGDFQFLVTSNSSNDELMNKIGMVRIGRIIEEPEYLIKVNNLYKPLPNKGHRDINKPSFFLEVKSILEDINNNLKD